MALNAERLERKLKAEGSISLGQSTPTRISSGRPGNLLTSAAAMAPLEGSTWFIGVTEQGRAPTPIPSSERRTSCCRRILIRTSAREHRGSERDFSGSAFPIYGLHSALYTAAADASRTVSIPPCTCTLCMLSLAGDVLTAFVTSRCRPQTAWSASLC